MILLTFLQRQLAWVTSCNHQSTEGSMSYVALKAKVPHQLLATVSAPVYNLQQKKRKLDQQLLLCYTGDQECMLEPNFFTKTIVASYYSFDLLYFKVNREITKRKCYDYPRIGENYIDP